MNDGGFGPWIEGLIMAEEHDRKILKPCPFCGSDDVHIRFFHGMSTVECYGCMVKVIQMEDDEPERFWNRRVKE